jgi:hypothetical protein
MADWDYTDWQGKPLPKPENWDSNPEWFDQETGKAKRIAGPRFVRYGDKPWVWGPTQWVRGVGEYVILCFRWDRSTFSHRDQTEHGKEAFAVWVGGEQADLLWESLDAALVDMVRFKHEGRRGSSGPRATEYFLRMIGSSEGEG